MSQHAGTARFLTACSGRQPDATPIWIMRQAGRCLAEYHELGTRYDILTMAKIPELRAAGHTHVFIAPAQLLADHLEIFNDIEIGATQQAEATGMQCARTESLKTSPLFITALAAVVRETRS